MDAVTLLLVAVVLVLVLAQAPANRQAARTAYRLAELDRRLALVMDHLGVVDRDPVPVEVRAHLARGDRIKAIAAYRKATGADLRSAKAVVDAVAGPR